MGALIGIGVLIGMKALIGMQALIGMGALIGIRALFNKNTFIHVGGGGAYWKEGTKSNHFVIVRATGLSVAKCFILMLVKKVYFIFFFFWLQYSQCSLS